MTVSMVVEPPFQDVLYIMRNLRDLDRQEASATSFTDAPEEWAARLMGAGPFSWAFYYNGTPAAIVGAMPRWTGVWNAFCLGTADFPHVAFSATKHVRRFMLPAILATPEFRRGDAFALAEYREAHRWLRSLGAKYEAALENWGKNGETFYSFVWMREATKPTERTAVADMR